MPHRHSAALSFLMPMVSAVLLAFGGCASAPPPARPTAVPVDLCEAYDRHTQPVDEDPSWQAREVHGRWLRAFNAHDGEAVAALYDPDAALLVVASPHNGARNMKGSEGYPLRLYFAKLAAHPTVAIEHERGFSQGLCHNNVVMESGTYRITETVDQVRTERHARFTLVYMRRDGAWKIVGHDVTSLIETPPAGEGIVGPEPDWVSALPR